MGNLIETLFHLKLNPAHAHVSNAEVEVWRRKKRWTHPAIREILSKTRIFFLTDVSLGVAFPT